MSFCEAIQEAIWGTAELHTLQADACSRYAVDAAFRDHYQEHWEESNGKLPTLCSFGSRQIRVSFAPESSVLEIPARGSQWTSAGLRYSEQTKHFDGKRLRVHY